MKKKNLIFLKQDYRIDNDYYLANNIKNMLSGIQDNNSQNNMIFSDKNYNERISQ